MKTVRLSGLMIGVVAAAVLGLAAPASAATSGAPVHEASGTRVTSYPTDCTDGQNTNGWLARCRSGDGRFKASVICKPVQGGPLVTRETREWSTPGPLSFSRVACPPLTAVQTGGVQYSS